MEHLSMLEGILYIIYKGMLACHCRAEQFMFQQTVKNYHMALIVFKEKIYLHINSVEL